MLAHLDDLASDFSAIHGVRDITALSGRVFFRLAFRLTAYQGVMRERVVALVRDGEIPASRQPQREPGGVEWTAPTKAALQASPVFAELISFG